MPERRYLNLPEMKLRRRELRNALTTCERILWSKLKARQLLGRQFRRQFSIGLYVLDFYCPELRMAVEVDGESHYVEGAPRRDRARTAFLTGLGIAVLRVPNNEVWANLDGVIEYLSTALRQRAAEMGLGVSGARGTGNGERT